MPLADDPRYQRFAKVLRDVGRILASAQLSNEEVANVLLVLLMTAIGPQRDHGAPRAVVMGWIEGKLNDLWPPPREGN